MAESVPKRSRPSDGQSEALELPPFPTPEDRRRAIAALLARAVGRWRRRNRGQRRDDAPGVPIAISVRSGAVSHAAEKLSKKPGNCLDSGRRRPLSVSDRTAG